MKTNVTKPCQELEDEIMEFIFSNRCTDHRAALKVWENNPWAAVSMYEIEHHPENLGMPIAFPTEVKVPKWFMRKLMNEELDAMEGNPTIVNYPRANPDTIEVGDKILEINKFGRIVTDDEEETD